MLNQFIDSVDVGVDQLLTLILGVDGSWVGQLARFPRLAHPMHPQQGALGPSDTGPSHSHHQSQLYFFAQARFKILSPDCCRVHKGGIRSPVTATTGSVLVFSPGQVQGPLSYVLC